MMVRQKHLWLMVVLFASLFFVGMVMGKVTEQAGGMTGEYRPERDKLQVRRASLLQLIKQLDQSREMPFAVVIKNARLSGWFRGSTFHIQGKIDDRQMEVKRVAGAPVFVMDGKPQEAALLPYALYTPYQHGHLIASQIQALQPIPLVNPRNEQMKGFQIQLPPNEVKKLLTAWMGGQFKANETMEDVLKKTAIQYQIWYHDESKQLWQIGIQLQMQTDNGSKQDQIIFRF